MATLNFAQLAAVYPAAQFHLFLEDVLDEATRLLFLEERLSIPYPLKTAERFAPEVGRVAHVDGGPFLFIGMYRGAKSVVADMPDLYIYLEPPENGCRSDVLSKNSTTLIELCKQLTNPDVGIFWGFDTEGQQRLWAVMSLVDVARSPDPSATAKQFFRHTLDSLIALDLPDLFFRGDELKAKAP